MSDDFYVSKGEPIECPFCHSTNTEILETFRDLIHRKVEMPQKKYTGMVKVTHYGNDGKDYYIRKLLCLDCGQISKSLPKETLQQYNEDKPYFKNY